jgi:hypothetical protein
MLCLFGLYVYEHFTTDKDDAFKIRELLLNSFIARITQSYIEK